MRRRFLAVLFLGACTGSINAGIPQTDSGEFEERDGATTNGSDGGTGGRDGGASNGQGDRDAAPGTRDDGSAPPPVDAAVGQGNEAGRPSGEDAARPRDDAAMAQPDAARDSGPAPSGNTVPVFVGVGYGTRRIISCDFGLTWKNDVSAVPNGGDDGTLTRGFAAGGGRFVAAIGGGGVQKLAMTEDGVTWTTPLDRAGRNGYSDVAYGNGKFVAGGGHISIVSTDGSTWGQEGTMGSGGILRHLTFGDYMGGRFVAVGDLGRRMASSDGINWSGEVQEEPALTGVAYGAGVFVAISTVAITRYSEDGGATWKMGNIPTASAVRGILFDGARFIVTTGGPTFTSTNGRDWTSNNATGGPASFDVSDDRKHYVGANGSTLYHSTDGISYMVTKSDGQGITRVKFQRVKPSSVCPL